MTERAIVTHKAILFIEFLQNIFSRKVSINFEMYCHG